MNYNDDKRVESKLNGWQKNLKKSVPAPLYLQNQYFDLKAKFEVLVSWI